MLGIGDWVQIGDKHGAIQAWGIETGFTPNDSHPVTKTSRKRAVDSGFPMILIWIRGEGDFWYPLEACNPTQAPLFR